MRLFLLLPLFMGVATSKSIRASSTSDGDRVLQTNELSGFKPLTCNENMQPCVNWSTKSYDPTGVITIPCGECVTMDSSSDLELNGLDIQGKLIFPDGYKITLTTPFIFVQGILEMTSTRATSESPDVKIILTGDDNHFLIPHPENSALCPGSSGCSVGNRPVIVAGGVLNIQGLQETCPTWVKLKNIVEEGPPVNANIPTYVPPSSGCSNVLIETDFENGQGVGYPSLWYRNYGGSESFETEDGSNYFTRWSGRTSNWNGPQTNFDPSCIVPDVPYFISARAKLVGISGNTCLKLISYIYDKGASPEKKWNRRGQVCTDQDDTWFDFTSTTVFDQRIANPPSPNDWPSRRLYWEGPPAGVDIVLDDVKIFRLPESSFPNSSTGSVCNELLLNGDAQDTAIHPFTYPFVVRPGGQYSVSIESEDTLFDGLNYYYAVKGRKYGYDMPRPKLWTDCIQQDMVYTISLDLRVHSSTPKNFRVQMTVTQPDGANSWPWMLQCPPASIQDGWVHCEGQYQFRGLDASASIIDWYLLSDDDSTSDVDIDNISMSHVGGVVTDLVLPDESGDLASCWGEGSSILVTSPSLTFDQVDTPSISSVSSADGTTTLSLAEPIGLTSYSDNEPDYAVEVALLNRNIEFTSDSTYSDKGGHLMIMKTPNVAQTLQGAAFRKFGQAGTLGRYPVHFHLCGSALGSVVSKNLVIESNQRCYVIHGSHNVTLDSNVAYDTHGHCFMLEDSGEMDNTFTSNLASVTRDAITLIRPEETDDTPSSFWLTNPLNTFIGNVAAGSEHSGFWFEMASSVRAPTNTLSEELSEMNPSILPLTLFEDNTAHSNSGKSAFVLFYHHGVKTYPGVGLEPEGEPAVFKNTKSYRNRQSGVFIHNSRNINIESGIFADNLIGIDIDRSPTCSISDATIIGYSPEYRSLAEKINAHTLCPSGWPIRGAELHTFWAGGDKNTGTRVENTSFSSLGQDTGCAGSTALRVDPENKGYFDVRSSISGLTFDQDTEPLSSCDAISATDEEMGPIDNVAIEDVDGSIIGTTGYIVSDNDRMTAFEPECIFHTASCTAHCPGACFRTMGIAVSTFEDDSLLLEITDTDTGIKTLFTGEYDWPLNSDGSVNMAEHTKTHRNRRFFATLPSGGTRNYEARFVKDGETHWPLFVKTQYEDPNHHCPEFASFTVIEPEVEPGYCDELIRNGDVSSGVDNWWATMGGVAVVDESSSGQGLAITSESRWAEWMGPAQYLDSRCMIVGYRYKVSAKVKLIHKTTNAPLACESTEGDCPKFIMKIESGAWEDYDEGWSYMGGVPEWDSSLEWNTIEHEITISQAMADAGSAVMYSECENLDALMVFDDVSVQKIID